MVLTVVARLHVEQWLLGYM